LGVGLGALGGAISGGLSLGAAFAIAIPAAEAPPGYWGRDFSYSQAVDMSLLAGAFWGGSLEAWSAA